MNYGLALGQSIEALIAVDAATTTPLTLIGNELVQTIGGNAGANLIIGLGGADLLVGRTGDDTYIIDDNAARVYELVGEGTDTVLTNVSYQLEAGFEIEALLANDPNATTALVLIGNERAQGIAGNAGANDLRDGGGAGADTLVGRTGNDTYLVGNSATRVFELAGQGNDTVFTTVNTVLEAGSRWRRSPSTTPPRRPRSTSPATSVGRSSPAMPGATC